MRGVWALRCPKETVLVLGSAITLRALTLLRATVIIAGDTAIENQSALKRTIQALRAL